MGKGENWLFSHRNKLLHRSKFWKKLACCPQQELRTMHSEGSHAPLDAGKVWAKHDRREKPWNLLQSDEPCSGAPLNNLRSIPKVTSGSNKGLNIVLKTQSRAITWHSGGGGGRKNLRNASYPCIQFRLPCIPTPTPPPSPRTIFHGCQIVHWDPLDRKRRCPKKKIGLCYLKLHGFYGNPLRIWEGGSAYKILISQLLLILDY